MKTYVLIESNSGAEIGEPFQTATKVEAYDAILEQMGYQLKKISSDEDETDQVGLTPSVLIVIEGGAVQSIRKTKGITLEIRDYDIEVVDLPEHNHNLQLDEDGVWYQNMFWDADEVAG